MTTSRIPAQRSGLRISVQFNTRYGCAIVSDVTYSAVRCENVSHYQDGSSQGAIYHSNSIARAFAAWLTPSADDFTAVRRAQWSSNNSETGEVEADVYPEFAADVLRKIQRLNPRSLSVHSVSI